MKATLRGFIFILFTVAGGMVLLAGMAQGADDAMPPEVKALIGMKLPPVRVEGKDIKRDPRLKPLPQDYVQIQPASIPGWKPNGGWLLDKLSESKQNVGVEKLYRDDLLIFVVDLIDGNDKNKIILDAQVLPQKLLRYYVKNGAIEEKKKTRGLYEFNAMCERDASEIIVGLMRPEAGKEDCQHKTTQVSRAWKIDSRTGHITTIPANGVTCLVPAEDWCN